MYCAATAKHEREVERQEELVFIAEESTSNASIDVAGFSGPVVDASASHAKLPAGASAASNQISRATTELC